MPAMPAVPASLSLLSGLRESIVGRRQKPQTSEEQSITSTVPGRALSSGHGAQRVSMIPAGKVRVPEAGMAQDTAWGRSRSVEPRPWEHSCSQLHSLPTCCRVAGGRFFSALQIPSCVSAAVPLGRKTTPLSEPRGPEQHQHLLLPQAGLGSVPRVPGSGDKAKASLAGSLGSSTSHSHFPVLVSGTDSTS